MKKEKINTDRLFGKPLNETDIYQVPPTDENGNVHMFSIDQLAAIYEAMKPLLNAQELQDFNDMSPEDQEQYLTGFGANILEWKKAKEAANDPNSEEQNGMPGQQPPEDGLDHWQPVKKSKNKSQQGQQPKGNKVYSDIQEELDKIEQENQQAEQDAENSNNQSADSSDAQDIADNASDIASSAQKMADAAQAAADAAQNAADQADENARDSGSPKDVRNADRSQNSADAAQDLANQAKEAAERASQLAKDAQEAADRGDTLEAERKAKEAYDAAKEASNKTRAAQINAKDALNASKQTQQGQDGQESGESGQQGQMGQQGQQGQSGQSGQQGQQGQSGQQGEESGESGESGQQGQSGQSGQQSSQMSGGESGQEGQNGEQGSGQESNSQGQSQAGLNPGKLDQNGRHGQIGKPGQQGQQGQPGDMDDADTDPTLKKVDNKFDQNGEIVHKRPVSLDMPFDGNDFVANDEEMREKCREMAERAGQPLDADDYISPQEYATRKYQEAKSALQKWKQNTPGSAGNPPGYLTEVMDRLFATEIDWRDLVQEFMTDKSPEDIIDVWSKRRMGLPDTHPFHRGRYLHPYEDFEERRSGIAQVFFLVDASGSMGVTAGDGRNIFEHIMSELIQIELQVKIKRSAYATFNAGHIYRDDIFTWTYQDAMDEESLMEEFKLPSAGGGTSAIEGIKSIQEYEDVYSTNDPWTLLIVVTDGGDYYEGLKDICKDPEQVEHMLWIITAEGEDYFKGRIKALGEQGVPSDHIVCVDINKEWGVDEEMVKKSKR